MWACGGCDRSLLVPRGGGAARPEGPGTTGGAPHIGWGATHRERRRTTGRGRCTTGGGVAQRAGALHNGRGPSHNGRSAAHLAWAWRTPRRFVAHPVDELCGALSGVGGAVWRKLARRRERTARTLPGLHIRRAVWRKLGRRRERTARTLPGLHIRRAVGRSSGATANEMPGAVGAVPADTSGGASHNPSTRCDANASGVGSGSGGCAAARRVWGVGLVVGATPVRGTPGSRAARGRARRRNRGRGYAVGRREGRLRWRTH
jgi:hypothetical protein